MPELALQAHVSAQQAGQIAADRQPQAGAAEAPGGRRVALGKGLEQAGLDLGRDARPGVVHLDANPVAPEFVRHQPHAAPIAELEGVVQKIGEHLAHPQAVTHHPDRQGRVEGSLEPQCLLGGQGRVGLGQ